MMSSICQCFAWAALPVLAVPAQEPITIESLLQEMVDRDSVARFQEWNFRLRQHSSYNRALQDSGGSQGLVYEQ